METCSADRGASSCLDAAGDNGTAKRVTNAHLVWLRRRSWRGQNVWGILR